MEQLQIQILVRDSKPLFTLQDKKEISDFWIDHDNQTIIFSLEEQSELTSSQAMKFYRGIILPAFVPKFFQTPYLAHDYFTAKFLAQTDVIDLTEESPEKIMQKIVQQSQKSKNTIQVERLEDRFIIHWIKSTTILKRKEMSDYMNQVMLEGNEQGIEFPEPKKG